MYTHIKNTKICDIDSYVCMQIFDVHLKFSFIDLERHNSSSGQDIYIGFKESEITQTTKTTTKQTTPDTMTTKQTTPETMHYKPLNSNLQGK